MKTVVLTNQPLMSGMNGFYNGSKSVSAPVMHQGYLRHVEAGSSPYEELPSNLQGYN
jgi:hypothetical protein